MKEVVKNYRSSLMTLVLILGMGLISEANAQDFKTISGTVTSEEGKVLKGVNLFVANTSFGTTTDAEGNFEMQIPTDSKVVLNYIGFFTKTIDTSKETDFQLKLQKEEDLQEDIVVVNYAEKGGKSDSRTIRIER